MDLKECGTHITVSTPVAVAHKCGQHGSCVGVGEADGMTILADTKTGQGLAFCQETMALFLDGIKAGKFDF